MRRFLLVLACVLCAAGRVRAQQSFTATVTAARSSPGTSGYPGSGTCTIVVTFGQYDQINHVWSVLVVGSCSGSYAGETVVGTMATGTFTGTNPSAGYAVSWSGTATLAASTSFNFAAEVGGNPGGFYGTGTTISGTSPAAPPVVRGANIPLTNSTSIPMVYVAYDVTTGAYVDNTAIEVAPGQSGTIGVYSNGDNMEILAISETLAEFNSFSTTGTGSLVSTGGGNGFYTTGTQVIATLALALPYAGMQVLSNTGSDPTGGSVVDPQGNAAPVSGAPSGITAVTNVNGGNVSNGTATNGTSNIPVFAPGTNTNQTGNTTGLSNGQYNQGVNALLQQVGNVTAAVIAGNDGVQGVSLQGTNVVAVSNFPTTQAVNGTVNVGNFPSSLAASVSFPSTMAVTVTNFPSSLGGGVVSVAGFPSSIGVASFPSNYPDSTADADLDAIKSALLAGASFVPSDAVASAQAAGVAAIGAQNWGPTVLGTPGVVTGLVVPSGAMATVFPSWTIAGTSGINISFISSGQFWAAAAGIMTGGRLLIALAMCVAFMGDCGRMMRSYVIGIMTSPQAVSLPGVEDITPGIAQSKMVVNATAITVVMAGFVSFLLVLVDTMLGGTSSGLSVENVASAASSGNFTALGDGLILINQYFPCLLLVQLGVLRTAMWFWTAPVYAFAAALIRFLNI